MHLFYAYLALCAYSVFVVVILALFDSEPDPYEQGEPFDESGDRWDGLGATARPVPGCDGR